MTTALQTTSENQTLVPADVSVGSLEAALGMGDFSRLTSNDRLKYVAAICQSVGLNPLTKPFDYITLQGKLTLYANKGCAEQLRKINGVTIQIVERQHEDGIYMVRVKATDKHGRSDESLGCVPLPDQARGEVLANAMMKAETKAKRRVTLSICGLGLIDESEVETVRNRSSVVTDAPSASDQAASLNAQIVDVNGGGDERGELLAGIQSTIKAAIPGTDSEAQRAKAAALQAAFMVRSWSVVEALPVEQIKAGAAKLTEVLMNAEAVDVVATPAPAPVTRPVVTAPIAPPPKPAAPAAPEEPPFDLDPPAPVNGLDDVTVTKLEQLIGEHGPAAANWMLKQGWLKPGQHLGHITRAQADKIIARPDAFIRAVNTAK